MKKFRVTALVLAGALSLTLLAACSGGNDDAAPETTPPAVTEPAETEPVETQPVETPEATEPAGGEETPAPGGDTPADPGSSDSSQPETPESSQPAQKPQTSPSQKPQNSPSQQPSASPSQEPDSSTAPESSVVQSVWNDISALGIPSLTDVDAATLSALYGIDSADLEEYVCKIPLMNVQATEFFIAKVKDGKMDTVKSAVESRQADLEAQWSQYLPDQLELVQGYQLVVNGNYILFAISEYASDAVSIFNSYTK